MKQVQDELDWQKQYDNLNAELKKMIRRVFDLEHEREDFVEMLNLVGVKEGDLIIDLGANLGQQIDPALDAGAEIHAFEPHPLISSFLRKKYGHLSNVLVKSVAAGASSGKFRLFYKGDGSDINGGASLVPWKMQEGDDPIKRSAKETDSKFADVETIDISEYILSLDRQVKILKIDIEGLEYEVLSRLVHTGAIDKVDFIFFEDHSDCFLFLPWFAGAIHSLKMLEDKIVRGGETKVYMWNGTPDIEPLNKSLILDLKNMLEKK